MRPLAALLVLVTVLAAGAPGAAVAQTDGVEEPPPVVEAAGAVLWDPDDDLVLYGRAEDVARPMASTTKLMTLLLAAEAGALDDTVVVSAHAASLGGATLHLVPGQEVPMESLVGGLLLESGNDAAVAVAEHVAGSEETFVEAMNARAAELGLDATRFHDPHGLNTNPDHRAAPLDLARLAHAAVAHEPIARYAALREADIPGIGRLTNRNELIGSYRWATGVKTGFTSLAGMSLVASAEREGRTLYAVVLDSPDRFDEAEALLEHGFNAYRRVAPVEDGDEVVRYRWADADVAAVLDGALAATVPAHAEVVWRVRLTPAAERPLAAGTELGEAVLEVDGEVAGSAPLVAGEAVGAPPPAGPAEAAGAALQQSLRAFARLAEIDRRAVGAPPAD